MKPHPLSIVLAGASARAAAASALRAGLAPHCFDLFADRDLAQACPCERLSLEGYPDKLADRLAHAPPGPWMFLGGLENRPDLLEQVERPRWGMAPTAVRFLRSPHEWTRALSARGLAVPACAASWTAAEAHGRDWLLKAFDSAAGQRVRRARFGEPFDSRRQFLQQRVFGMDASAVFVADPFGRPTLVGATRQLIGAPWLRSSGFRYAGNVGPWPLSESTRLRLMQAAEALAACVPLRGLFGVDFVLRDDVPWIVEINPRYPASVEVLERSTGEPILARHRAAFEPEARMPSPGARASRHVAKGILFARRELIFPKSGPWDESLTLGLADPSVRYADLPYPGDRIESGHPILTLFADADDPHICLERLREKAGALEDRLFSDRK